jgi:hypothetical protein
MLIIRSTISGFRAADRIDPDKTWTDYNFVMYSLLLSDPDDDKYFPGLTEDLVVKELGWRG